MRYLNKKFIVLCSIIGLYLITRVFIFKGDLIINYTNVINPLFWLAMAILAYLLTRSESSLRQRSRYDITQTVIIILIIYAMLYFSLGLVTGYERSPYSHELSAVIKNLWAFISIIIFQEYVRFQLIKLSPKKISGYAVITILMIVADISFWSVASNLTNNVDFFKYISETILPLIVTNLLYTYLAVTAGHIPGTIYRTIMALLLLLLPIYPSLNWLLKTMMDIVLVIITALYVNYVEIKTNRILAKRDLKKEKITAYIPFVVVLIVLVCFIGGTFKYQPIAVLSNSMIPEFSRGDAVVIEKITNKGLKKLKKGTIIYYSKDGRLVIHRIVKIVTNESNNMIITTKGDNNDSADPWEVEASDIIGVVKFMIPFIGYPSVLVNNLLQ